MQRFRADPAPLFRAFLARGVLLAAGAAATFAWLGHAFREAVRPEPLVALGCTVPLVLALAAGRERRRWQSWRLLLGDAGGELHCLGQVVAFDRHQIRAIRQVPGGGWVIDLSIPPGAVGIPATVERQEELLQRLRVLAPVRDDVGRSWLRLAGMGLLGIAVVFALAWDDARQAVPVGLVAAAALAAIWLRHRRDPSLDRKARGHLNRLGWLAVLVVLRLAVLVGGW